MFTLVSFFEAVFTMAKSVESQSWLNQSMSAAADGASSRLREAAMHSGVDSSAGTVSKDALTTILIDEGKSAQERLAAVKSLVGRDSDVYLNVFDGQGRMHRVRLEVEQVGGSTLVHLFEQGKDGKEKVLLRGVANSDGSFSRQKDASGKPVSFAADKLGDGISSENSSGERLPGKDAGAGASNISSTASRLEKHSMKAQSFPDVEIETGGASARATAYYPDSSALEGGYKDMRGKPLYTLQDYLAGRAPYVSVAMDNKAGIKYGQKVCIPELEQHYGKSIPFKVVDTGSAFRGKGTSRIDICVANEKESLASHVNRNLTLKFV